MPDNPNRLDLTEQLQRLAPKSRRIYGRWIQRYLGDIYQVQANRFNLAEIRPEIIATALTPEHLTRWLDDLYKRHLSGATIVQARSAVIWLAGQMSTLRQVRPEAAGALTLVKSPRQPNRQEQTWLTMEQSRALFILRCFISARINAPSLDIVHTSQTSSFMLDYTSAT